MHGCHVAAISMAAIALSITYHRTMSRGCGGAGGLVSCVSHLLTNREDILFQKLSSRFHLKSPWSEVGHRAGLPESREGFTLGGRRG